VAFQQYEHIVNCTFTEVDTAAEADFVIVQTATAPALLGQMRPPGEENAGLGDFNKIGFDYDEPSTHQGGYSYITFIHEFGHGMGLAHPHDNGGSSEVMHGVTGDVATGFTTGDFGLNQGIFTTMSYNDGWPNGPDGTSPETTYGYQGTLMALDVAVLQQKYGANLSYHTGNDTYVLPSANAPGTFYACIWDAGGADTLKAGSSNACTIDLRPATLQYEIGGGGFVSWEDHIYGGFTIANGVVIENAKGGGGGDSINGNDAANLILGAGGDDAISGFAGNDTVAAGNGNDTVLGGDDNDTIDGAKGNDTLDGGDGDDLLTGGTGADTLTGGAGSDTFIYGSADGGKGGGDLITDLTGGDFIDLSAIDADLGVDGDQAFAIVRRFDGHAGELRFNYNATSDMTKLMLDVDGDKHADFTIMLAGNQTSFGDFVL
jgi:serralysin